MRYYLLDLIDKLTDNSHSVLDSFKKVEALSLKNVPLFNSFIDVFKKEKKNEKLTKAAFLEKINQVENLIQTPLDISALERKTFTNIILDSTSQLFRFEVDIFEENKSYLEALFANLIILEKILLSSSRSSNLFIEPKQLVSLDYFHHIMDLAGNSFLKENQRTYLFQRLRLRIIYFLLYISGLKPKELAFLDYHTISDLLTKKPIQLKGREVILKDFNTTIKDFSLGGLISDVNKDMYSFFIEREYKFLGCSPYNKLKVGDLDQYLRVINNDLEFISKSLNFSKLTTQNFRYTFITNLLKFKSFSEIKSDYPYLNKINKKTYFD